MIVWALAKLAPLWGRLIIIAGALAAVAGAVLAIRKGGRDAERRDVAERTIEDVARAVEVGRDVDRLSPDDARGRLRRWQKD